MTTKHINFDTRNEYGEKNSKKLENHFLYCDFDIPLWGTKEQFERDGLMIKKNSSPVKLSFYNCSKKWGKGVKHYSVYNFSQTLSV